MTLVSVVVISYNSEQTIIELLDSIANQSYPDIELIVADDCSKDRTISLARQWCSIHKSRFRRIVLTISRKRQGVVYNANRGISRSQSEYLKLIAGDDVLLPNCIEDNMAFLAKHDYGLVFSKVNVFGDKKAVKEREAALEKNYQLLRNEDDIEILKAMYLPSPSIFLTKKLFSQLGGFDTRFPNWEDAPFYTKMICKSIPFGFLDKETVKYRLHKKQHNIYRGFAIDYIKVYLLLRIPALIKHREIQFAFRSLKSVWNKVKLLLFGKLQNADT